MTGRLALVALTMSVVVVSAGLVRTQTTAAEKRGRIWLDAVRNHRPGELDDGVRAVAQWSQADLIESAGVVRDAWARDVTAFNDLLARAALLHADIAMLHRTARGYDLPPTSQTATAVHDGQVVGLMTRTVHWDVARALLSGIRPKPAADARVRLWYQATSAYFQYLHDFTELMPNLRLGLQLFPTDATLLLYAGTMHESYAAPRIQNTAGDFSSGSAGRAAQPVFGSVASELKEAERYFRDALAADPTLGEAHIRLGNVLGLRERHAEAIPELKAALEAPLPAELRYIAMILLGREHLILGDDEPARAQFEQAARLYPSAQAPRLGLSELAREAGSLSAALAPLQILEIPPVTARRADPFWEYERLHSPDVVAMIARLRSRLGQ